MGTAALVIGILALVGSFFPILGFGSIPMGILGAALGLVGLSRVSKGQANNKGASIAGLVLSAVAVVTAIVVTAVFISSLGDENSGAAPVSQSSAAAPPSDNEPKGDDPDDPSSEEDNGAATKGKQSDDQESAGGSDSEQFPGQTDDDVVAKAGGTIDFDGTRVTAAELKPERDAFASYLCTKVTYVNKSDEEVSYNMWDWELQSPQGNIENATFATVDDTLSSGELAPGGTVSGLICFDPPAKKHGKFVVQLDALFSLSDERGAWINKL